MAKGDIPDAISGRFEAIANTLGNIDAMTTQTGKHIARISDQISDLFDRVGSHATRLAVIEAGGDVGGERRTLRRALLMTLKITAVLAAVLAAGSLGGRYIHGRGEPDHGCSTPSIEVGRPQPGDRTGGGRVDGRLRGDDDVAAETRRTGDGG